MIRVDYLLARVIGKYVFDKGANELSLHTYHFLLRNFNMKQIEKSSVECDLGKGDAKADNLIVEKAVCQINLSIRKETSCQVRL